ncbi:hypothetical protein VTK73DRAFT_5079 [Phialemonium thermophilum]|uniref:Uncharacterized protein n=1 Tax=Phialemonium thermophilum TaxID=223376 RepID=A0ABR3WQ54_9PEZI
MYTHQEEELFAAKARGTCLLSLSRASLGMALVRLRSNRHEKMGENRGERNHGTHSIDVLKRGRMPACGSVKCLRKMERRDET